MGSRAQRVRDDRKTENQEKCLIGKVSRAQHKNDRAEQSRANEKREETLFPPIKGKRKFAEQKRAERASGGYGEQPPEQNGQDRESRVHYLRNPMRVRMKPNFMPSCGET